MGNKLDDGLREDFHLSCGRGSTPQQGPGLEVRQATESDLRLASRLFDGYRRFYGQPSDIAGCMSFLLERMKKKESVLLLALEAEVAVGICHLYPTFSSIRLGRTLILNDLFVRPTSRGAGIGRMLLDAAYKYGKSDGVLQLSLSTALDNVAAQKLYESAGWTREVDFLTYEIGLS